MTDRPAGEAGREGLFAALKGTLATLLDIGRTRAELLVIEIEEEKERLISLWAKAIGAAFLLAVGVVLAVFGLALAFWEQRVVLFGLFALLFLAGALLLVWSLRRQLAQPTQLFRSSLSELSNDIDQLTGRSRQ